MYVASRVLRWGKFVPPRGARPPSAARERDRGRPGLRPMPITCCTALDIQYTAFVIYYYYYYYYYYYPVCLCLCICACASASACACAYDCACAYACAYAYACAFACAYAYVRADAPATRVREDRQKRHVPRARRQVDLRRTRRHRRVRGCARIPARAMCLHLWTQIHVYPSNEKWLVSVQLRFRRT